MPPVLDFVRQASGDDSVRIGRMNPVSLPAANRAVLHKLPKVIGMSARDHRVGAVIDNIFPAAPNRRTECAERNQVVIAAGDDRVLASVNRVSNSTANGGVKAVLPNIVVLAAGDGGRPGKCMHRVAAADDAWPSENVWLQAQCPLTVGAQFQGLIVGRADKV